MCLTAAEISTFGYPYYGNANKMRLESTIAYEAHSGLTIYGEAIHDKSYRSEIENFFHLGVYGTI